MFRGKIALGGRNFSLGGRSPLGPPSCGLTNLKLISKQKRLLRGPRHAPPRKFKKFTCCNGCFSAF